jgi:hypothetical protein
MEGNLWYNNHKKIDDLIQCLVTPNMGWCYKESVSFSLVVRKVILFSGIAMKQKEDELIPGYMPAKA